MKRKRGRQGAKAELGGNREEEAAGVDEECRGGLRGRKRRTGSSCTPQIGAEAQVTTAACSPALRALIHDFKTREIFYPLLNGVKTLCLRME